MHQNGEITLTTGSCGIVLFITITREESSKLTSSHSERIGLLVACIWSQERESYMSILMVWRRVLCGLDYQHTNHSGVWLMFMDAPTRYNLYHLVSDYGCPLLYLMYLIHSIILIHTFLSFRY